MGVDPQKSESSLPSRYARDVIVDERCTCGNLRSNHDGPSNSGLGPSADCRGFTWAAFVLADGTDVSNEVIPW